MRTLLSAFCEQFDAIARPLKDPLDRACDTLSGAPIDLPARRVLPGLREVRQQFDALVEKVAAQQSYVLIFGPLKSGKSTLMNAVSAAYVSEVTCLPAYPCMVYVSHREERELRVTRYDGQSATYPDPAALRRALNRGHGELAEKLRSHGEDAETFDPATHFPEAIRRVDVGLPASELDASGAVLVDTPGLYARMKFGYDRMTREFRNTAACAVFVVKTDNLFLEQVFEEFGRLLDLFSRIFLVVNLDSTKKDLKPDGTLEPSLESEDPSRVVEAFERLSMDEPLRQALREGKLRIYPVDLLRAASRRLRSSANQKGSSANEEAARERGSKAVTRDVEDFDAFLTDLTDYLNSSEYLRAFLGDSLRQADTLVREATLLCATEPVRELAGRVRDLKAERDAARARAERVALAAAQDWRSSLLEVPTRVADAIRDRVEEIRSKAEDAVGGVLDRWFAGSAGLGSLLRDEAGTLLASSLREAGPVVSDALRRATSDGTAGARVEDSIRATVARLGLSLDAMGKAALEGIDPLAGVTAERAVVDFDSIPVRKGFWDRLLFRRMATVKRRILGTRSAPAASIPATVKAKRLGAPAREALRAALVSHLDAAFPRAVAGMAKRSCDAYAPAVAKSVLGALTAKAREAEATVAEAQTRLQEVSRVADDLACLATAAEAALPAFSDLAKRHDDAEPATLRAPAPEGLEAPRLEAPALEPMTIEQPAASGPGSVPATTEPEGNAKSIAAA